MTPDLRREVLADHARRRTGFADPPSAGEWREARLRSATCGDDLTVRVLVEGGVVAGVEWHGLGCEVSQASASMLAELVPGRAVADVEDLVARVAALVRGPEGVEDPALADAEALAGVGRLPLRGRCALLSWNALRAAAVDAA
ncbi:Fe-S cluster assembly sulfur transfer protein SufU [Naasia sp. SYSU D00057]|uniref:Fe-S cluster assembly sulfur transfer protein SufU n=1 Tax=Naasia sp. SYSU D00057 TaxID=2817380 RepID=UPI001B3144EE|nr:SUF system NifU family Fe-S cluster assembly protein [Naasia sp. SYSU D00057]